mmetsp:Transcript_10909/g.17767  ORF Transcript_10909/g.17767 Transcript_10909/m.17767 type:complete len:116 (-) Transcript_10909:261-608(-)
MKDITLRNVTAIDTLPLFEGPGVILCDPANPCTGIVFDGVTNEMFPGKYSDIIPELPVAVPGVLFPTRFRTDDWTFEYLTSNVYGSSKDPVEPAVCMDESCYWEAPSSGTTGMHH